MDRDGHPMRIIVTSAVMLLTAACTAGWNALVRYSPDPVVEGETVELGLYAMILGYYASGPRDEPMVVVADGTDPLITGSVVAGSRGVIRGHWADTLRHQVSTALLDPVRNEMSSHEVLSQAAALYGIELRRLRSIAPSADNSPIPRLWVWRAGFNADSTIAAIDVEYWCGTRCAHGSTYLLARRPGHRWRIWYEAVHWYS